jgi:hypothetical protein
MSIFCLDLLGVLEHFGMWSLLSWSIRIQDRHLKSVEVIIIILRDLWIVHYHNRGAVRVCHLRAVERFEFWSLSWPSIQFASWPNRQFIKWLSRMKNLSRSNPFVLSHEPMRPRKFIRMVGAWF